jgi:hypothetical protein
MTRGLFRDENKAMSLQQDNVNQMFYEMINMNLSFDLKEAWKP